MWGWKQNDPKGAKGMRSHHVRSMVYNHVVANRGLPVLLMSEGEVQVPSSAHKSPGVTTKRGQGKTEVPTANQHRNPTTTSPNINTSIVNVPVTAVHTSSMSNCFFLKWESAQALFGTLANVPWQAAGIVWLSSMDSFPFFQNGSSHSTKFLCQAHCDGAIIKDNLVCSACLAPDKNASVVTFARIRPPWIIFNYVPGRFTYWPVWLELRDWECVCRSSCHQIPPKVLVVVTKL